MLSKLKKLLFEKEVREQFDQNKHVECAECGGERIDFMGGPCTECDGNGFVNMTRKEAWESNFK